MKRIKKAKSYKNPEFQKLLKRVHERMAETDAILSRVESKMAETAPLWKALAKSLKSSSASSAKRTSKKQVIGIFIGLSFSASISNAEQSRPMSEMHGGCENYAWNMKIEMEAWDRPAKPLTASTSIDTALTSKPIPLAEKVRISLQPEKNLKTIVTPGKASKEPAKSYGGIIPFQVAKSGVYRISAGSRLWYEVVEAPEKKKIESSAFEMQTGCEKILKSVAFPLIVETRYLLQITGSSQKDVEVLLSAEKLR